MQLILKSNNPESLAKIVALAKKLNVVVEKNDADLHDPTKAARRNRILNFRAEGVSSFGDASGWGKNQREDRHLPI
jgi:hypothetical protein